MDVQLSDELQRFVEAQIAAGRYRREEDVVRDVQQWAQDRQRQQRDTGQGPPDGPEAAPSIIGMFRDDDELIEQITNTIMEDRQTRTLRRPPHE